ncbi:hypothetical protein [Streptomyces sp. NPDC047315]|uniref:hypothetical protein n=1 Tax=Streptomyces sp. NPDC047315 TaxID=3155142 RepID=UPI0033E386F2
MILPPLAVRLQVGDTRPFDVGWIVLDSIDEPHIRAQLVGFLRDAADALEDPQEVPDAAADG